MLPDERAIGAIDEVIVGSLNDGNAGIVLFEGFRWDSSERDDIEGGSAVIHCDLNGDDFFDSGDALDGGEVVFRKSRGRGAEAVLAIDDKRGVIGTALGGDGERGHGRWPGRLRRVVLVLPRARKGDGQRGRRGRRDRGRREFFSFVRSY